ncbi:MAG: hypothetical protein KAH57_04545, partial [Thermoplasmata archaeon]|nr:hypothetical protein [Thermoplasmata archaeon]
MIILISVNVNAAPHHVNYDDVDANISIILSYVQNAMDEINLTFEAMLSDDPANATVHGEHFIDSVKRVNETLEMIPVSVDSYQTLLSFQLSFSRFETNFSLVLSGYTMVIGSLEVFESYDVSVWVLSSLGENLTSVDGAIDEYEEGFAILDERVTAMRDDLEALGSSGLNVEEQMDLSSGIIGYMDLNYHALEREDVADELVSHLVPEWSDGLRSLVDERDVDDELAERLMILDLVVPTLSPEMLELLGERMDLLKAVDVNIAQFHDNQTRFLLAIEALVNVTIRPVSDQYDLFNSTRNAYEEMEGKLEQQWMFLKEIDPINGDVIRGDLTALEELLGSYRERLDNITLLIDQLNKLAGLISLTLERNAIPADGDLNGQISFGEMRNLTMPLEMFSAMDEMVELHDVIENELSSMGSPWRDEVDPLFFSLSDGIDLTSRFSIDHDILVTHLVNITFINETEVILQDEGHLLSAISNFNRMNGTISELESQLNVIYGLELEVNISVLEPLSLLLGQYKELLERLAGDMNISGLFLSFDDDVKPYDSTLLLNVLYLHRDPFGKVSYSDDDIISFFLDNVSLMEIFTSSGSASGVVPITRDMALGDHQINVSVNSSTYGEIVVSRVFTVRKILTDMVLTSSSYDVDLNEEVNIHVSVRDEFNRDVKGTILLDGKEMEIDGTIGLDHLFSTYGNHSIVGNFSGEEYYFNSSDELMVTVRDDPVLSLFLENNTIEIGEMIVGELVVEKGEGLVEFATGEMIIPLGFASNTSEFSFSLNSSLLGLGSHRVQASLTGSGSWVRDGVSPYVTILIIE